MRTVRIQARRLGHALSAEEAEDLRWLVEDGGRWVSQAASERLAHCRGVQQALAGAMRSSVQDAQAVVGDASEGIDGTQQDVVIEVDAQADMPPWELLDFGHGPVGLACRSVSREPAERTTAWQAPAPARTVLNVLLVIARPFGALDVPYLAVSSHFRYLLSGFCPNLRVTVLRPPTYEALVAALGQREPFDVLHFDGHGDQRPEGPILLFENAAGRPSEVRANAVVSLARSAGLKLIVLNACRSAQSEPELPTRYGIGPSQSSLAYRLASEAGVPVVAMRYLVSADRAGRFVGAFYESLLEGCPPGVAVQCARRLLRTDARARGPDGESDDGAWLLPVYYSTHEVGLLVQPIRPPSNVVSAEVLSVHGMDTPFLLLEKTFQAGRVPIVCGAIGSGKLDLARAFAAWFQRSSAAPIDIEEAVVEISDRAQGGPWLPEAAAAALQRPGCILVVRLELDRHRIGATDYGWLQASLLAELKTAACRFIVLWDSAPKFIPSDPRAVLVALSRLEPEALREHARDVDADVDAQVLEELVDLAAGNPMYVRTRAARIDPTDTRWFKSACRVHEAATMERGLLECLREFEGVINIFTLRRTMHLRGVLPFPPEHYLSKDHDESSPERRSLEQLTAGGLLIAFSPNTYLITPWLRTVWSRLAPTQDDSGSLALALALAFARSVAETCVEYQMDYFSRGYRDVVLVIEREERNIARSWQVLQGYCELDGLVKLLAALAAMWTLQQRFDLIETRAQALEQQLLEASAPDAVRDSLLTLRLQAAYALGRVDNLADAVRQAAERYQAVWRDEGEPRGTMQKGMPSSYRNMLDSKQNWAAVLRITQRRDLHRSVCEELLQEYERADDVSGVIRVLKSLTMALGPRPLPDDAREIRDLLKQHVAGISKDDGILQSEVLSDMAQLGLVAAGDPSGAAFAAALDEAIAWLNQALELLPPVVGSNHAHIHQRLADCYLRQSRLAEMDEHFQSAIAIFETLGAPDLAAYCAASAADGWAFFRNAVRAQEYARSAVRYLSQSSNTPIAQETARIVRSLGA